MAMAAAIPVVEVFDYLLYSQHTVFVKLADIISFLTCTLSNFENTL